MGDAASGFINDQVADAVENAGTAGEERKNAAQEETKGGAMGGLRGAVAGQAQDFAVGEM